MQARRPAQGYWFALFGAHSDPRGRVVCFGCALAFLAFPLADLLSGRLAAGSEVVGAAGLAAFAVLFLRLFWILPRSRPSGASRGRWSSERSRRSRSGFRSRSVADTSRRSARADDPDPDRRGPADGARRARGPARLEPDLEVVAQVSAGDEVGAAAREHRPDVALLDIEMPGMDGIEAAAALRREVPDCVPLILTTFGRPAYLRRAMEAGAAGFLVKDAPAERLAAAIRRAVGGERVVDAELAAAALAEDDSPLTSREREVLEAGASGAPISEIAERLHLSEGTVRNYLSAAIGKVGARNRVEAWRSARDRDWL